MGIIDGILMLTRNCARIGQEATEDTRPSRCILRGRLLLEAMGELD